MSFQFMIGRSGTGKTKRILEEIKQKAEDHPMGDPVIYLVPEQMTFLSEYHLASDHDLGGVIRAQVYSFTRLAWRILQETGGISRQHITSAGLNMLIQKIIDDKKEDLKIFAKAADKTGFISHVETMLTELKRYCLTPEELTEKQQELKDNRAPKSLTDKLEDLQLIYSEFEQGLTGKYVDAEDYLKLLSESIQASDYIKNAEIYIDGFHSFTPQEYLVMQQLMKHAKRVTIALTVDQLFTERTEDTHLFRMTGETSSTIYEMAKQSGVKIEETIVLTKAERYQSDGLKHLEQHFDLRPAPPSEEKESIHLIQSASRRAEIEGVAREIRKLAREQDVRYKQIAVLIRNSADYQQLIQTVFKDYDIPFFIDQKQPMFNHPLIELIRSTLEIINSHWRYESVFRAVKTDLLFPMKGNWNKLREQMDRLENFVLAYGIKGERWTSKERWSYRRYRGLEQAGLAQTDEERKIEDELNELKLIITKPITRLTKRLKKAATSRDYCEALYLYLEELGVPEKMEKLSLEAEERKDLVTAREHSQAWNAVIELFDQYVEVLGDEQLTIKKFSTIIDAGLEAMRFAIVPPAADQVIIANLELSRLADVDAAFIIGMNEGVLPAKMTEEGILGDEDRETLSYNGIKLAASSRTRLLDEEFIAYKAFTTPSSRLYVTYPLANDEGKSLQPSPYIKRMKELFPNLSERLLVNEPSELNEEEQLQYICHPEPTLSYLTSQLQLKMHHYPMYDFWWDVYNYYVEHPVRKLKAGRVLSSLFYTNEAQQLDEPISTDLYGQEMQASVSRMELFHSCPFSHFATHGLKLRDREVYRLEAPAIGDLFHGALKWIAEEVTRRGLNWASLSQDQCMYLAKEAVVHLSPKLQNQILLSSNRHLYIKQKLENIVSRASYVLSEQARKSGFSPLGIELGFGMGAELPPLAFQLKNGTKMTLAGRIDRVDQALGQDETYLRVIDYKSSGRDIDMTEVYYGFALQMLTYLDIILTYSTKLVGVKAKPAGVLYFHVHNPIISSKKIMTLDEIEKEILKSFKMKGLVLGEEEAVRLMDTSLTTGDSQIISAGFKKDGGLTSRSKVAAEQEFDELRGHVRKLYQTSGDEIVSGKVDIVPYKYKKRTPCQFCSYRPVCQFDQTLEENNYRVIAPIKQDEIICKIREEASIHDQATDSN
ncbi:ATP-dependent helicase/nuclease subunit B [Bacillus ectoiniformans]|uniref:helicase-exonuclease AddAB subunit AddB n=1 Tax=Bacillus ectoiniformans TaxID=1494429 RepID=UPI00195F1B8D|nr:helicase-exonuclease AddAB subunit AddB [Bacillus ectoiniformans]MBM7647582.1 ATP-dependent helicase/nuclease subunit B [Bacillus ectoiniformans]